MPQVYYRLYFKTNQDKNTTIRVNRGAIVADNIVRSVLNTFVTDNKIKTSNGTVVSAIKAQRVTEDITEFNVN